MKWSKIKREAEDLLADSLKGRVAYHLTRYGRGRSFFTARSWVTFDNKEIIGCSTDKFIQEEIKFTGRWFTDDKEALEQLGKEGLFSSITFVLSIDKYINMKVSDALKSKNPLVRAFAMFDRRLGKRRLMKIRMGLNDYQVVKDFHHIRCQAEGISKIYLL